MSVVFAVCSTPPPPPLARIFHNRFIRLHSFGLCTPRFKYAINAHPHHNPIDLIPVTLLRNGFIRPQRAYMPFPLPSTVPSPADSQSPPQTNPQTPSLNPSSTPSAPHPFELRCLRTCGCFLVRCCCGLMEAAPSPFCRLTWSFYFRLGDSSSSRLGTASGRNTVLLVALVSRRTNVLQHAPQSNDTYFKHYIYLCAFITGLPTARTTYGSLECLPSVEVCFHRCALGCVRR